MEQLKKCSTCGLPRQFFYKKNCSICDPPPLNEDGKRPLLWDILRAHHMQRNPRIFDNMIVTSFTWIESNPRSKPIRRDLVYVDAESRDIVERAILWNS